MRSRPLRIPWMTLHGQKDKVSNCFTWMTEFWLNLLHYVVPTSAQNRPLLPDLRFVPTSFYFQIIAILFAAVPCTFAFSSVWEGCLLLHFSVFFTVGVLGVFQSWRSCILLFFFHIVDTWWSESGKKRYMVDLRGFVIVGISSQTKAPRRILGATILL